MVDTKILCEIAKKAGDIIMEVYSRKDFEKELKSDNSPVTVADKLADGYIRSELQKIYADIPIISEEHEIPSYEIRKHWKHCFIVDPLDGTKEFIKKNGEFTVNIAYVKDGKPVEGVVYAPAKGLMYHTLAGKAYKGDSELPLSIEASAFRIVTSRSHISEQTREYIDRAREDFPNVVTIAVGSSLKLCMIAEGRADVYPRFGPTCEWDIAAAQAIVEQSGGSVNSIDTKSPLTYNKEDLSNDWFEARQGL